MIRFFYQYIYVNYLLHSLIIFEFIPYIFTKAHFQIYLLLLLINSLIFVIVILTNIFPNYIITFLFVDFCYIHHIAKYTISMRKFILLI